jgi:flagellar basal-body rod protein FlgB
MFENIGLFQTAGAMARHAAQRQAVTAQNMANADTPGYRARTLDRFSETYRAAPQFALTTTRAGHLIGADPESMAQVRFSDAETAPNGNSVSLEDEMLAAVDNQREHDRALAIYKHAMTVLRTALGR